MQGLKVNNLLNTTLEEAMELYKMGMILVIRDGKIKGMSRELKALDDVA